MPSIELKIKPFAVPTAVSIEVPGTGKREDGMGQPIQMKLEQLDEATLAALCEEFMTSVFAAAGKTL